MKSVTIRILALLLTLCMLFPLAACANNGDKEGTSSEADAEETTGEAFPDIAQQNYGRDFHAIYCSDTFRNGFFFVNEEDRRPGNDLDDRLYERAMNVKNYLGVNIVAEDGGIYTAYASKVKQTCFAGDPAYQLVMTHVYYDVASLLTSGYLMDFKDLETINLDASYWNKSLMQELAIGDSMYCGYNDFCLSYCYLIGFNKNIMTNYQSSLDSDLYTMVRNKEWTLDKMISIASLVSQDNGDGKWDEKDTYGFAGLCWVPVISFVTSSDIKLIDTAEDGSLYLAPMVDNAEKYNDLAKKLVDFNKSNATYMYFHDATEEKKIHLPSERLLFEMLRNYDLITYAEEKTPIGVLPYPLYDTNQKEYKTLNWNGVLGIPSPNASNSQMVSDVMEMLAYYTAPVKVSFYEKLMGARIADAPEDAEMLNIIWASQISDLGLVFSHLTNSMDTVLYALPTLVHNGRGSASSTFASNKKAIEKAYGKLFKDKE